MAEPNISCTTIINRLLYPHLVALTNPHLGTAFPNLSQVIRLHVATDFVRSRETELRMADGASSAHGDRADRRRHEAVAGFRVFLFAGGDRAVGAGRRDGGW